jgi:ABC-type Fe3+ transport system substrate-binding protein
MAEAFQKKFALKTSFVSAPSDLPLRVMNEAQAGRYMVDVFDGPTSVAALKKAGLVMKWQPPSAPSFPPELVDPDGYWMAANLYVQTMGYNTNLAPEAARPHTIEDLLDPKWKGKIGWSTNQTVSGGPGYIGATLTLMGEAKGMDYLKRLARQNIIGVGASARTVLDQVITGEYPLALQIFNYHAPISAAKGAPVAWAAVGPSTVSPSVVSVAKHAPHPNAAKLLAEFLVSEDGQRIFRDANYIPANPKVPPLDPRLRPGPTTFKAAFLRPEAIVASMPKWSQIFNDLFR